MNSIENAPAADNNRMEGLPQSGEENQVMESVTNALTPAESATSQAVSEEAPAEQESFFAEMRNPMEGNTSQELPASEPSPVEVKAVVAPQGEEPHQYLVNSISYLS